MPHEDNTDISREAFLKEGVKTLKALGMDFISQSFPFSMAEAPKKAVACIELTECTAFRGSGCQICYDVCPLPNVAITLVEKLPQVLREGCTGCNICVEACPTPNALALI